MTDLFQHQLDVTLEINGTEHRLSVPASATLLDVLRERLQLYGTKKGCDLGSCGACTVLVDGRRANACLMLAAMQDGRRIATIEGVARDGALHPLQQAFIKHDALQCGYCTPGQIMSALGLIAEGRAGSDAEIAEQMSGNLCRCGAYPNIVAAVAEAARS
ncbi:MAG: xanthine dehydrogenase YagT iron-sulfur-binding subunit [Hyphomicrobiales bacterium]